MTDKGLAIHEANNRLEIAGARVPHPTKLDAGSKPNAAVAVALPGAGIQITTREYLTIKKADLGSSCGLRGPLALLAL